AEGVHHPAERDRQRRHVERHQYLGQEEPHQGDPGAFLLGIGRCGRGGHRSCSLSAVRASVDAARSGTCAVEAKRFRPSPRDRCAAANCPRTLLPAASSGWEKEPSPPLPGAIATIPPATPDLAGRPISNSHSPELSYMPVAASTARVS